MGLCIVLVPQIILVFRQAIYSLASIQHGLVSTLDYFSYIEMYEWINGVPSIDQDQNIK